MLDSVDYLAYVNRTIAFSRTIVIKCEDLAILDNALMERSLGLTITNDKRTWRYYMNLNGDYHSTDTMMEVTSLDNGETIDFTKANLDIHPATKRAYRQGSYYYSRLTDKYPGQQVLINGIITPIPPEESIPAKNYQILRYNQDYVLWNEYQLMPALQEHIYNMVSSSFNTEYLYTDNLMLAALLGNLYGSLVSAILQIREDAKGTRYAHEFHIWSRLASLGLSTIYKQVLDRKQTMWLYRNLKNILRLQGRQETFDQLVENILTHRKVPLARYEVLQTSEEQLTTLVPEARFISKPVNLVNEFGMNTKLWTVPELVRKERDLALDNERNEEQDVEIASFAITYDITSQIPTKVLESTMIDATDRNPLSIMKVLHNHWIYLSGKDYYVINHDFVDLRTGRGFRLNTKEAYILWCYLIDRYRRVQKDFIPYFDYYKVRKINPPTYQQLMQLGHQDILTEQLTKDILNVKVDYERIISPDSFFLKCKEIFDKMWDHKKLYSRVLNMDWRSQIANACDSLYETADVRLTNTLTYQQFLIDHDMSFADYGDEELLDLAWAIWKKVTGWENVDFLSVADQQRSLINLMADLSSYTVQYIGSTDSTEGNYEIGCELLLDTDAWNTNGDTSLEDDKKEYILVTNNRVTSESSLETTLDGFSVEGNQIAEIESEIVCESELDLGSKLFTVDLDPEPSAFTIPGGMMLTMEPYE